MGTDTAMIALDSNTMTHWIDAMSNVAGPPTEPERVEKVALARIFFWMPNELCFHYTPTVEGEYQAIKDRVKRDNHLSWALSLISPVRPLPDLAAVQARVAELKEYHKGEKDRRLVAECELTEILTLLTCDRKLLKNFATRAAVRVCLPSAYWELMAVPRALPRTQVPHPTNPMSRATWWHW